MSIENIIDYVIKTPKNTNPNVIRSLVKSEVDENTLQKAKEYTDANQLAKVVFPSFDAKWDGNPEGHETSDDGFFIKISDQYFPASELDGKTMTMSFDMDGQIMTHDIVMTLDNQNIVEKPGGFIIEYGGTFVFAPGAGVIDDGRTAFTFPSAGFYVMAMAGVRGASIPEEVKTVNPKYLPGVVLPVVEIATPFTISEVQLSDEDGAKLEEVKVNEMPIIVKCFLDFGSDSAAPITPVTLVFGYAVEQYISSFASFGLNICKQTQGYWTATILPIQV